MRNAGLDKAQAGIRIARININNLRYTDDTTLWQEVKKWPPTPLFLPGESPGQRSLVGYSS